MQVRAIVRNLRMSPKKVRLVIDVIRGLDVFEAKAQLGFINKKAALPVRKLLDSAIANATNNFGLRESNLYVKEIMADGGPSLKRWRPQAFGRAAKILKRTSHVLVVLGERVPTDPKKIKKPKVVKAGNTITDQEKKSSDQKPKEDIRKGVHVPSEEAKKAHIGKIFDVARKGKHRRAQHQDKKGS